MRELRRPAHSMSRSSSSLSPWSSATVLLMLVLLPSCEPFTPRQTRMLSSASKKSSTPFRFVCMRPNEMPAQVCVLVPSKAAARYSSIIKKHNEIEMRDFPAFFSGSQTSTHSRLLMLRLRGQAEKFEINNADAPHATRMQETLELASLVANELAPPSISLPLAIYILDPVHGRACNMSGVVHALQTQLSYWHCSRPEPGDTPSCSGLGGCHRRCWWRNLPPSEFHLRCSPGVDVSACELALLSMGARIAGDSARIAGGGGASIADGGGGRIAGGSGASIAGGGGGRREHVQHGNTARKGLFVSVVRVSDGSYLTGVAEIVA